MAKTLEEKQAIELAEKFIKTGLRGSMERSVINWVIKYGRWLKR